MSNRKVIATVGEGGKVELTTDLPAGTFVEVQIEELEEKEVRPRRESFVEWLRKHPVSERTKEEWDAYEEELRRERDAWD